MCVLAFVFIFAQTSVILVLALCLPLQKLSEFILLTSFHLRFSHSHFLSFSLRQGALGNCAFIHQFAPLCPLYVFLWRTHTHTHTGVLLSAVEISQSIRERARSLTEWRNCSSHAGPYVSPDCLYPLLRWTFASLQLSNAVTHSLTYTLLTASIMHMFIACFAFSLFLLLDPYLPTITILLAFFPHPSQFSICTVLTWQKLNKQYIYIYIYIERERERE